MMSTDTEAFVKRHGITLELLDGPDNTTDAEGWEHNAYRVELHYEARTMVVPWRQGIGITDDPNAANVLDAIASDSVGVENAALDFESWCAEYGYDTDSRRAEATYSEVCAQAHELHALLGDDLTESLLYETERL